MTYNFLHNVWSIRRQSHFTAELPPSLFQFPTPKIQPCRRVSNRRYKKKRMRLSWHTLPLVPFIVQYGDRNHQVHWINSRVGTPSRNFLFQKSYLLSVFAPLLSTKMEHTPIMSGALNAAASFSNPFVAKYTDIAANNNAKNKPIH